MRQFMLYKGPNYDLIKVCYFYKLHFNMEFVPLPRQKCVPLLVKPMSACFKLTLPCSFLYRLDLKQSVDFYS